jgi:hypothetical protein
MLRASLVVVLLVGMTRLAAAWPTYEESLDHVVADADLVVRATIVRATKVRPGRVESIDVYRLDAIVHETFKGPRHEKLTFATSTFYHWDTPPTGHVLLFLIDVSRSTDSDFDREVAPYTHRMWCCTRPTSILEIGSGMRTSELMYIRGPAVQSHIRRIVQQPSTRKQASIPIPKACAKYKTSQELLVVPVDEHLEKRARKLMASSCFYERYHGLEAIAPFHNPANVALVTTLLRDPGYHVSDKQRFYNVRYLASATLNGWNVAHAEPTVSEPVR